MTTQPMRLFDPGLKELVGKRAQAVRLSPTTQNEVSLNALLSKWKSRLISSLEVKTPDCDLGNPWSGSTGSGCMRAKKEKRYAGRTHGHD